MANCEVCSQPITAKDPGILVVVRGTTGTHPTRKGADVHHRCLGNPIVVHEGSTVQRASHHGFIR